MKVEAEKTEITFQPFKLMLSIENEHEAHALLAMCLTNDSVPRVAQECWGRSLNVNQSKIKDILTSILYVLEAQSGVSKRGRHNG